LANYLGYKKADFVHAWGAREQEWETAILERLQNNHINVVVQQHTKASDATLKLIDKYNLKTIVLVRNIFDVIPSLRDHLLVDPRPQPVFNPSDDFHMMDSVAQLDMIIDLGASWYINFYVSWYMAIQSKGFTMVTYEDFFSDIEAKFKQLCEVIGFPFDKAIFKDAKDKTENGKTRLNVGEKGRGQKLLNDEQKNRIIKLASYYPKINFEKIGIHKNDF
jgi:hypothetical protein